MTKYTFIGSLESELTFYRKSQKIGKVFCKAYYFQWSTEVVPVKNSVYKRKKTFVVSTLQKVTGLLHNALNKGRLTWLVKH